MYVTNNSILNSLCVRHFIVSRIQTNINFISRINFLWQNKAVSVCLLFSASKFAVFYWHDSLSVDSFVICAACIGLIIFYSWRVLSVFIQPKIRKNVGIRSRSFFLKGKINNLFPSQNVTVNTARIFFFSFHFISRSK